MGNQNDYKIYSSSTELLYLILRSDPLVDNIFIQAIIQSTITQSWLPTSLSCPATSPPTTPPSLPSRKSRTSNLMPFATVLTAMFLFTLFLRLPQTQCSAPRR